MKALKKFIETQIFKILSEAETGHYKVVAVCREYGEWDQPSCLL